MLDNARIKVAKNSRDGVRQHVKTELVLSFHYLLIQLASKQNV